LDGRRFWRVPVMDGEFLVEEKVGVAKGVAGGNIILQAVDRPTGLDAARRGAEAVAAVEGAIAPFPGGVARSGSKVGSRYKALKASTSDAFCPTLRGRVVDAAGSRLVEEHAAATMKRTWVNYGRCHDWRDPLQGEGEGLGAAEGHGLLPVRWIVARRLLLKLLLDDSTEFVFLFHSSFLGGINSSFLTG